MLPRSLWTVLLLTLLLSACAAPTPVGPTPTPSRTPFPPPPTLTATPTRTVTPTLIPTVTPSPTLPPDLVSPTHPAVVEGPFESVQSFDWAPGGLLTGLFATGPNDVWLVSKNGAARFDLTTSVLTQTKFRAPATLLGLENTAQAKRLWLISYTGDRAFSWDGSALVEYGSEQGWILTATKIEAPVPESFAVSQEGKVWISTARDVRRFDGKRWDVFTSTEIGTPYLRKVGITTSFVVGLQGEDAWAGSCYWEGETPIGGGGLRRYDGSRWLDPGFPNANGCVTAVKTDGLGRVWAGVDGSLWRYDPIAGEWRNFSPPGRQPEQTIGLVPNITIGPEGDPWPFFRLCDPVGCHAGGLRYHIRGEDWIEIRREQRLDSHTLLFDGNGNPWLFTPDGIFQLEGDTPVRVSDLVPDAAVSDPAGDLWMVTDFRVQPVLWLKTP